jgi:hypothetical protein
MKIENFGSKGRTMRSTSPSRAGNTLVQSLLVFPLCLTAVAMSAIPSAIALLGRDQPTRWHAMSSTVVGSGSSQLQSEDWVEAEPWDEGLCAQPEETY